MDPEFWHARWQEGQIGFHQVGVHPDLLRFGEAWLAGWAPPDPAAQRPRVLVPLCGKSHDLPWLASRAREVVGVELSALAAQALMAEHAREFTVAEHGPYGDWRSGNLRVWVGDVFALDPARDGLFDRVWDRAALVALDPPRRARYVERLRGVLAPGAEVLLNFFGIDAEDWSGPPFSVAEDEVRALWAGAQIAVLDERDGPVEPRMAARGARRFVERLWRVGVGA